MIDLHIHTNYSDGSEDAIEILRQAEKLNLEIISITDHDEVDAYFELNKINIKDYYSGVIVRGIEIKSIYKGVPIEILGYGIDIKRIKDSKYIINQIGGKIQQQHLDKFKKIGKDIGLKFDDNIHIGGNNVFGSAAFGEEIHKYRENKEIIKKHNLGDSGSEFYRKGQSDINSIFYIDESEFVSPPNQIISEIHQAGGLAFVAHPLLYPFENKLEVIEMFINEFDIDGLECYYSLFNEEETRRLVDLCNRYNIYISGGSDYHGLPKPNINMGTGCGNLNITRDIVKDWIDKL